MPSKPPPDYHDVFVSTCLMATALAALVLSFWQIELARDHNKRSTRPALNIVVALSVAGEDPERNEGITIENKGLGPAMFKSMRMFLDGSEIVLPDKVTSANAALHAQLNRASPITKDFEGNEMEEDDAIKENDVVDLFVVKSKNVLDRVEWLKFLDKRLGIVVKYCSIYAECWTRCYNAQQIEGCRK